MAEQEPKGIETLQEYTIRINGRGKPESGSIIVRVFAPSPTAGREVIRDLTGVLENITSGLRATIVRPQLGREFLRKDLQLERMRMEHLLNMSVSIVGPGCNISLSSVEDAVELPILPGRQPALFQD